MFVLITLSHYANDLQSEHTYHLIVQPTDFFSDLNIAVTVAL